ncbi:hypothetical protein [Nocardioides alcanivorans]|uniref:hypothetical protein n=1 Tax=Nocardioides alcanivorans TaxID=2897352 RepID=UPI001F1DE377|nr:hypothetical protein [Nocardioides alcanivorans]
MRALRIVLMTMLVGALLSATAYGAGYAVQHLDHGESDRTPSHTTASRTPEPTAAPEDDPASEASEDPGETGSPDGTDDSDAEGTPSGEPGDGRADEPTAPEKPEKPELTPVPPSTRAATRARGSATCRRG